MEGLKLQLGIEIGHEIQSCAKTFLLSVHNHSQNVPLTTTKLHCGGAIFQPAIPESFFTLIYAINHNMALIVGASFIRALWHAQHCILGFLQTQFLPMKVGA